MLRLYLASLLLVGRIFALPAAELPTPPPSERVVAFYYPWYGNPSRDGGYANWNHPVAVRNEPPRSFPGGDDIGANYYPALGCYSVNDPEVLSTHMQELRRAGVGVLCASWWGRDSFTDRALPGLFRAAEAAGLFIDFHLEPFPGRNAETTREAIAYLVDKFGASPACHRLASRGNRPVFFVYDSYLTPAREWAAVLTSDGPKTIRDTSADAVVIGLWVKEHEEDFMLQGGFDGFYTYFATDGFTFGSTTRNWPLLANWARTHEKLFVPCVAPGYIDTRIRPWNGRNTRDREDGVYYDRMWSAAIEVAPELVAITSFNEWHEGTQIEPAVPKRIPSFDYLDYQPRAADFYLHRTAHWANQLRSTLTLSFEAPHWLVIHAPHLPGGEIRINYLEAYCRAGSTDADWVQHTVIPHRAEVLSVSDDRKTLRLRDTLDDGVIVEHTIIARDDEVDFRLLARNPTAARSEAHWAQPCVRLADFTGFDPRGTNLDDYLPQCFVFLDGRLVRLPDVRPWAKEARYTPGQVWCPAGVPRSDVNPRPLSPLVPSNGLIGAFSRDERWIFATAWEPYQELFQGVIRCLHSDPRLGGLEPGESKSIRGKIYLVTNDVPALLARYARDFPEQVRPSAPSNPSPRQP